MAQPNKNVGSDQQNLKKGTQTFGQDQDVKSNKFSANQKNLSSTEDLDDEDDINDVEGADDMEDQDIESGSTQNTKKSGASRH